MRPTFDMDALRTMVLGTDLGSFTRAAIQLGRSQSAISMQLKKLEQQAGRPLFSRSGRGLVPTEAGDELLTYARRIVALNDEAAASLGATADTAAVRLGLPQDFFEDLMPEAVAGFSRRRPGLHVEVRAGRNYALADEVRAGRLDAAIAFFPEGSNGHGTLAASLPLLWLGDERLAGLGTMPPVPLVLFDHPCLFRQTALKVLDSAKRPWRPALTTPSLPGLWAALRMGHGITVRTPHRIPAGIHDLGPALALPGLPRIELRMVAADDPSPAARDLQTVLAEVVQGLLHRPAGSARDRPGHRP